MSYKATLDDARSRMDKALGHLHDVLRGIRTSRASAALVENIRVEYYGTPTPLNQIASISIPDGPTPRRMPISRLPPPTARRSVRRARLPANRLKSASPTSGRSRPGEETSSV